MYISVIGLTACKAKGRIRDMKLNLCYFFTSAISQKYFLYQQKKCVYSYYDTISMQGRAPQITDSTDTESPDMSVLITQLEIKHENIWPMVIFLVLQKNVIK